MIKRLCLLAVMAALVLAGCAASGKSGAVQAVESYYKAIIDQNPDKLSAVTCKDFEEKARTELDSFNGVKIEMQGLSCKETGASGGFTQVHCDGQIVATYGQEKMNFPLSDRVHQVKNESGDWRVCGY